MTAPPGEPQLPAPVDASDPLPGWPADPELEPYGSRMLPRFGLFLRGLARFFFSRIDDDSCDVEPIREAGRKGSIVYVMRTRSLLDYLYFNYFVREKGLPLARFANGVRAGRYAPFGKVIRSLFARVRWRRRYGWRLPDPVQSGYLARLVRAGQPVLVFLRWGRKSLFGPRESDADVVQVLVEAQATRDEPIFLVPQILVWERSPDKTNPGLLDVLMGPAEDPGFVRKTLIFLRYHRHAVVRLGEPVNLTDFLEQHEGQPPERVVKKLRWLLLGSLFRERRVVKGPDVRPRRWIFDRILAEPEIRGSIEEEARREGRAVPAIEKRARRILNRTGADFSWGMLMTLRVVMDQLVSRLYSGVEVDPAGAERMRKAARNGTVVLIPSHRSHFDYLLLSWVLYYQGMMPPHIAAGVNLSFWPMGSIFRRSGAFFIRRSFGGDRLYTALLTHYVRALTSEGYTQEFFIEGGRSRSGKMLSPKIGLLWTYLDAMADRIVPDIQIVPIYIAYEKIVEDYAGELAGDEKKKETAGELVKASSVLRRRFGRVYVQANEPISLKEALEALDRPWRDLSKAESKDYLRRLSQHIVAEIQDVTVVTPSTVAALALLIHDRRGMTRSAFHRTCRFLVRWLEAREASFSDAWQFPEDALDETLELFAAEKYVEILADSPDGSGDDDIIAIATSAKPRLRMDYYKNNILFHFVPAAFVCTAVMHGDAGTAALPVVQRRFDFLADLFRQEFIFHPDLPTDFQLGRAVRRLQEQGILRVCVEGADGADDDPGPALEDVDPEQASLRLVDRARAWLLASTIRNFIEAYYVVLEGSHVLRRGPMTRKELVAEALKTGRRMFLTEDVTRPEAVGKVNLDNAARQFQSKGVLVEMHSYRGRDPRLVLDEEARERYLGPMGKLFRSTPSRSDGQAP